MSPIVILVLFIFGILIGWFFGQKNSGISKPVYDELLRREATSQEKIKNLNESLELKRLENEKIQIDNLNINKLLSDKQSQLFQSENNITEIRTERDLINKNNISLNQKNSELSSKLTNLEIQNQLLEQQLKTLREYIEESKKQSKIEFENLANQILDAKTKSFSETTEKNLDSILKPLKEKIQLFEKSIDEKYNSESKERHALKGEIEKLISLNDKMTLETNSLTQALRGDSKFQGDWGELVLQKILESSGLRENEEFSVQEEFTDEAGNKFRPDIVIKLKDNKHIIVDSKVSLKAYETNHSSNDEITQKTSLKEHLKSMENHIEELHRKHYDKLKGINSPEFVFMFIPIEPAYLVAIQADPELSVRAWKKGVAIVTSNTLFSSLKTVGSIWKLENQNKNALEIAKESAGLIDKFQGFFDDFLKLGNSLEHAQKQYSESMSKLKTGQGNIFKKLFHLQELGANPKKKIGPELIE